MILLVILKWVEGIFLKPQYVEGDPVLDHCSACAASWLSIGKITYSFPVLRHRSQCFTDTCNRNSWKDTCVTFHWLKDCLKTNPQWTGRRPLLNLFLYFRPRGKLHFITPAGGIIAFYPHFFPCFAQFLVTSSLSTASILHGQGINPPFHSLGQLQLSEFNLPAFFLRPSSRCEAWKVWINWIRCLFLWSCYYLRYRSLCVEFWNTFWIRETFSRYQVQSRMYWNVAWWTAFRFGLGRVLDTSTFNVTSELNQRKWPLPPDAYFARSVQTKLNCLFVMAILWMRIVIRQISTSLAGFWEVAMHNLVGWFHHFWITWWPPSSGWQSEDESSNNIYHRENLKSEFSVRCIYHRGVAL